MWSLSRVSKHPMVALNTIGNSVSREGKMMQKRPKQEYTPRLGRALTSGCRAIKTVGLHRKSLQDRPCGAVETLFPIVFQKSIKTRSRDTDGYIRPDVRPRTRLQ